MQKFLASLVVVLLSSYLSVQVFTYQEPVPIFGFNPTEDLSGDSGEDWGRVAVVVVGSYFGILFSILLSKVRAGKRKIQVDMASLITASAVAPVIIGAIYPAVVAQPSLFLTFLLAYQNGFFWEAVLKRGSEGSG